MEKAIIVRLHKDFEKSVYMDQETGLEFWLARELQNLLGYAQWRSFEAVIEKAKTACKNSGHNPQDHFAQTRKMVDIGSGAERQIDDIALTRYACYLIAQNGDPSKDQIAFAKHILLFRHAGRRLLKKELLKLNGSMQGGN